MCGRYTLTDPGDLLTELSVEDGEPGEPRYNIAPTQPAPVIVASDSGERRLRHYRWGLVPWWAESPAVGARMINARSETAATKPAFREALRHRRCLVLADGFLEWTKRPDGTKQPFLIRTADRRPFVFAGLWESWTQGSPEILSFTILTTEASPVLRSLHDRMPVILENGARDLWLEPGVDDPELLRTVFRPFDSERLVFDPVSRRVNSVAHDDPRCLETVELEDSPPPRKQLDLF